MASLRALLVAVVVVAVLGTAADAFLFEDIHGVVQGADDAVNATIAHVARVARRCLGLPDHDAGGLQHVHDVHHRPESPLFFGPAYPEPPPSSVELCASRGFLCERHLVDTADGYVLAVIHVVSRVGAARVGGRPAVLVQHGMLMSSDAFLLRKDDDNLPLYLHDAGYDVWVGNYRANAVSPHVHADLDPDSFEFWNFSWHEMGLHDLPALVDYVLAQTAQADLHYIGHSMGTTGVAVLLSSRPEYNGKIRLASLLAPVAYVSTLRAPLFTLLSSVALKIKAFLEHNRIWNVLPRSPSLHRFFDLLCLLPVVARTVCEPIIFEIAGKSPRHVLPKYSSLLAAYLPAGTTIRILEHYYEVARTGKFRPLGYGTGDPNPGPEYNVSAISAPVALFYAQNDNFVYPPDVDQLASDLPNVFYKYKIRDSTFNHFDFIFASDGRRLLFEELLATMRRRDAGVQQHANSLAGSFAQGTANGNANVNPYGAANGNLYQNPYGNPNSNAIGSNHVRPLRSNNMLMEYLWSRRSVLHV